MAEKEKTYDEAGIAEKLADLPGWFYENGWIRRNYKTDGWPTTLMLVNAIGYLAATHLLSRGCRTLAYLTTEPAWDFIQLRGQGFALAAHRAGCAAEAFLVGQDEALTKFFCAETKLGRTLEDVVDEVVRRRPAGLFVSRDEEVVQVYRLLAERGVVPGRDVHVISCDNENVRLSMLHPRPATIEIGTCEIARRAVRRLETRIHHPSEPPVRILANPRLVLPPATAVTGGRD